MSNQEKKLSKDELAELFSRIERYYSQIHVHYLIASQCLNREFAIISPDGTAKRNIRVHNAQSFQHVMKCWNVMPKFGEGNGLERFYRSAAIYQKGLPYSNPDLSSTPAVRAWNGCHTKNMIGYDLFIDIDDHQFNNFKAIKETMQLVHEYFKKADTPHEIIFSGRGFHVIVPHDKLPKKSFDPENTDSIYSYCFKKAKYINSHISELVDKRVYESRQLIKCPYTLVYNDELRVCTPLTDEKEIYDCQLDDFTPESVDIQAGFKLFCDKK